MGVTIIASLLLLMLLGVPIAFSIILACIIVMLVHTDLSLMIAVQRTIVAMDSFPLMAIPFFILAGTIMSAGGISRRLVSLANTFVGHYTGGIALVCIMASMFFAAISGSGAATTAAVGSILIPSMIHYGYGKRFAGATQAVAGELGVIIPPSIPMILYGVSTSVSIGSLFIAGIIPGLMIAMSLFIFVHFYAKKKGFTGNQKASWGERGQAFKDSILALLMPIIILGGIYGGVFTPTEAAAFAVFYGFIVSFFIYREIKIKDLTKIFGEAAVMTATIMIIIGGAGLFGWLLTHAQVPQQIAALAQQFITDKIVFLLLVNLFLLIIGMFFEAGSAILILAPILAPIAISFGIDPIHFGIIMVVNLAIGMVTPPLGVNLFIASNIAKSSLEEVSKGLIPYLCVLILNVLIISYFPALSLWLPSLGK